MSAAGTSVGTRVVNTLVDDVEQTTSAVLRPSMAALWIRGA